MVVPARRLHLSAGRPPFNAVVLEPLAFRASSLYVDNHRVAIKAAATADRV